MKRILIILAVAWLPTTASALEADCRDVSAIGLATEQYGKAWQLARKTYALAKHDKTDIVQWLVSSTNTVSDMHVIWGGLMCLASRDGDTTAVQLRNRWSTAIRRSTDGFSIARAESFFLDRLKTAPADQQRLLSEGERALLAETLAFMEKQNERYARIARGLSRRLQLPAVM